METRAPGDNRTDHWVQVDVLNALDRDPLQRTSFGVAVSHGVVTLWGLVPSRREAWLAEQAAYSVPGVRGIVNELKVDDGRERDSAIAEAVLRAVTPVISPQTLKVLVSDGTVTLCGVVADVQRRASAERVARRVDGVERVWNALHVVPAPRSMPAELAH